MAAQWVKRTVLSLLLIASVCNAAGSALASPLNTMYGTPEAEEARASSMDDLEANGKHEKDRKHWAHKMGWSIHHQMYLTLLVEKYAPETKAEWAPVMAESEKLRTQFKALMKEQQGKKHRMLKSEGDHKAFKQQMMAVQERFTEAVLSKDEAQIKASLKELLPLYKQKNEQLAKKLQQLQKAQ